MMACITDHYKAAVLALAEALSDAVDWLTPSFGKPLAIGTVVLAMLPLGVLMFQVGRVLVPDFVKWWYDETITQKAREYVRRKCPGTGMTVKGAKTSFMLGFVFFFVARFTASLPLYYMYSVPAFLIAFAGIVPVIGYFVSGNVPDSKAARYKYFRRFQGPSITGAGLGFATSFLEFLLEAGILAAKYVQVT
jgi:hypothetical protein